MSPAGDLHQFERDALLSTGEPVHLAPARRGDETRITDFYRALSDTSTYFRFFTMRRSIPLAELLALTNDSTGRCVAILASTSERLVGIGELHVIESGEDAEIAFAVCDDFQHRGVATLLLEDLAVIGRHMGLSHLIAHTLAANEQMKLVLRTAGLSESHTYEDGVVTFSLDLARLEGLAAAAATRADSALARASHPSSGAPTGAARRLDDSFGPLR